MGFGGKNIELFWSLWLHHIPTAWTALILSTLICNIELMIIPKRILVKRKCENCYVNRDNYAHVCHPDVPKYFSFLEQPCLIKFKLNSLNPISHMKDCSRLSLCCWGLSVVVLKRLWLFLVTSCTPCISCLCFLNFFQYWAFTPLAAVAFSVIFMQN